MDVSDKEYKRGMQDFLVLNPNEVVDNDNCFSIISAAFHERILLTARTTKEIRNGKDN